ncbi:MAG: hypothetical protein AAF288_02415 [Planctomycetota bacterium]
MSPEQVAADWRKRFFRWAWLRVGVLWTIAYLLAWGVITLVVRGAIDADATWLWWGAAGVLPAWGWAGYWTRRQVPSKPTTMALLDRENQLGGMLMADSAVGREPWTERLGPIDCPRVTWQGKPGGFVLGLSLLFVLAAQWVPMPRASQASNALDVTRTLDWMQQQVEVLAQEQVWDNAEAEQTLAAMDRIHDQSDGDDPSKTWEALDHLAEQIDQASDEAVGLAQQRMEEAAGVEALSQALQEGLDSLAPDRLAEAMATLAELADAAAGEPSLDGMDLPHGLTEALEQAGQRQEAITLTPQMLDQLGEAMAQRQSQLQELLEALDAAGLGDIDPDRGGDWEPIDPTDLLVWLEGEGQCDGPGLLTACRSLRAGRGGIDDGPGHAEMIWKDPASREGVAFTPELLPQARLQDLLDARLLGTSRGAPEPIDGAQGSAGGALAETLTNGGSAAQKQVLPRHRGAVRRYFERETE